MATQERPVTVSVIDDYDLVVKGTADLLEAHRDRIEVVERTAEDGPATPVDVALLDCFGVPGDGAALIDKVASHPNVGKVAVYTWGGAPELIEAAIAYGAAGFLSKGLSGAALADALVAVHRDERPVLLGSSSNGGERFDDRNEHSGMWPGSAAGLTERESEVLALITQGLRNAEIAAALYLSINSIKTHTRNLYRKIGVSTRTEAALYGIDHGFRPDRSSRDPWMI